MIDVDARTIRVSAVVLRHPETGELLTVRKRGTSMFMQPGGKPEPGEGPVDTAVREIREELGVELDRGRMTALGTFTAPAANEAGFAVIADVFVHPPLTISAPAAEIEEIRWVDERGHLGAEYAPLMVTQIVPALRATAM